MEECAPNCIEPWVCALASHEEIVLGQFCHPMIWKVVAGAQEMKVTLCSLHGGQPGTQETLSERIYKVHLFLNKVHRLLVYRSLT